MTLRQLTASGLRALLFLSTLQLPLCAHGSSCDTHSHAPHAAADLHRPAAVTFDASQLPAEPESDATITPVDQNQIMLSNVQEINLRETEFSFPQYTESGQPHIAGEQLSGEILPEGGACSKEPSDARDNEITGYNFGDADDTEEQQKATVPEQEAKKEKKEGQKQSNGSAGQSKSGPAVFLRVKVTRQGLRNMSVPESARNLVTRTQPVFQVVKDRAELTIVTTVGQVITGGPGARSDALALGAQGTAITQTAGATLLHTGKLLIDTGKEAVVVKTKVGDVTAGANATLEIIDEPDKAVRFFCIRAEPAAIVEVAGSAGKIEIKQGEVLTLGQEPPASRTGDNSRGGDDDAIDRAETKSFSIAQFLAGEELFSRRTMRLSGARRASLDRLFDHLNEAGASESGDFTVLKSPPAVAPEGKTSSPPRLLARQGTTFSETADGALELAIGTLFVQSDQPLVVRTRLGQVRFCEHALALVDFRRGKLRVMSCSGPGSILVESGHHRLDLAPGREVLIVTHRPTRTEALPGDGIGRRHLAAYTLEGKLSLVCGDFSIASMLRNMSFLAPVTHPTSETNRQSLKKLIKVAASVQIATAGHGPYFVKPRQQASSAGRFD